MRRVSGQNRSAHRGDMPPWLWPRIEMSSPERRCIRRIACTMYSAATWMSPVDSWGTVTQHHGMPSESKYGA